MAKGENPANRALSIVGLYGCGDVTRKRHARLCAEGKKVHLRGFYSRSRRSAEAVAERYPAKVYGSLEEVLADPSTDAVLIATPEQTHSQIALQALEAGKHVLCEKPMAASRKEAVQMRETALVHNRKLMVNFNQRLYPEHQKIRELVGNGEIGRVLSYYTAYETRGQDCRPDGTEIPGFYDQIQHRHGVLAQVGIHKIDLMPYLLGSPVEQVLLDAATQVKTMGDGTPIPYEDRASLHLRHQKELPD